MRTVKYIVIHTAADGRRWNDTSAADIDRWHKNQGWDGIGYHWVIRKNGTLEAWSAQSKTPASVQGFNNGTLAICLSGHGDQADMTAKQRTALYKLVIDKLREYDLTDDFRANPMRVLGHREAKLVCPSAETHGKTCPGRMIDCRQIRLDLLAQLSIDILRLRSAT